MSSRHPLRPRLRRLPRRAAPAAVLFALAPVGALTPGCLCPPGIEDLDALGYRSPEATFRSFQLAVRADSPTVEYRCLSGGFRERNQLSQLAWREFREEWFADNPFLRRGIAKAELVSSDRVAQDRALLVAEAYGRRFELQLVREAFYQLYAEERLLADDLLPNQRRFTGEYLDTVPVADDRVQVLAGIEVSASELPEAPTELRLGLEWKIDGIRQVEDDPDPAQPEPQP